MLQTALVAFGAVALLRFAEVYSDVAGNGMVGIAIPGAPSGISWYEVLPFLMALAILVLAWN